MAVEEITFTPDRSDVESVQAAALERIEELGRSSAYTLVLIALAFVVPMAAYVGAGLLGYQSPVRDDVALAISIGFAAGLLVNYAVMHIIQRAGFRRQAALIPSMFAAQTLTLAEQGLDLHADGAGRTFVAWPVIDDAEIRAGHILVWQGPRLIAYAPLRAFATPAAADAFSAEVARRAKAARRIDDATINAEGGRRP